MTLSSPKPFNPPPFVQPATPSDRVLRLESTILAALASGPKRADEIRKFVQEEPGFDWTLTSHITKAVTRMRKAGRIAFYWQQMRTIPAYMLPTEPLLPVAKIAVHDKPATSDETDRSSVNDEEMRIVVSIEWPRFFHIPRKEDLLPYVKTRTGYDVRAEMNRF